MEEIEFDELTERFSDAFYNFEADEGTWQGPPAYDSLSKSKFEGKDKYIAPALEEDYVVHQADLVPYGFNTDHFVAAGEEFAKLLDQVDPHGDPMDVFKLDFTAFTNALLVMAEQGEMKHAPNEKIDAHTAAVKITNQRYAAGIAVQLRQAGIAEPRIYVKGATMGFLSQLNNTLQRQGFNSSIACDKGYPLPFLEKLPIPSKQFLYHVIIAENATQELYRSQFDDADYLIYNGFLVFCAFDVELALTGAFKQVALKENGNQYTVSIYGRDFIDYKYDKEKVRANALMLGLRPSYLDHQGLTAVAQKLPFAAWQKAPDSWKGFGMWTMVKQNAPDFLKSIRGAAPGLINRPKPASRKNFTEFSSLDCYVKSKHDGIPILLEWVDGEPRAFRYAGGEFTPITIPVANYQFTGLVQLEMLNTKGSLEYYYIDYLSGTGDFDSRRLQFYGQDSKLKEKYIDTYVKLNRASITELLTRPGEGLVFQRVNGPCTESSYYLKRMPTIDLDEKGYHQVLAGQKCYDANFKFNGIYECCIDGKPFRPRPDKSIPNTKVAIEDVLNMFPYVAGLFYIFAALNPLNASVSPAVFYDVATKNHGSYYSHIIKNPAIQNATIEFLSSQRAKRKMLDGGNYFVEIKFSKDLYTAALTDTDGTVFYATHKIERNALREVLKQAGKLV